MLFVQFLTINSKLKSYLTNMLLGYGLVIDEWLRHVHFDFDAQRRFKTNNKRRLVHVQYQWDCGNE